MFGFYTPILILQAFCIYHAYLKHAEYRWYWFIVLFPGVGCGFYLYHHFYNRENVNVITESVKEVVNSNYRIEQLEKALRFSDNHTNRINLAEEYVNLGRHDDAIQLYQTSLTGFMQDDPSVRMKLLHAHFLKNDYQNTVQLGEMLTGDKTFANSAQRIEYAWALHYS